MKQQAIYQSSIKNSSLRQGEILTNLVQYTPILSEISGDSEELPFAPIIYPYAIVVTQDCDLDWDYKARKNNNVPPSKLLNSVILCEVETAESVRNITKIPERKNTEEKNFMNSEAWNLVKTQRHERFYFFERIPIECELEQIGLPELTADFKRVFGIDVLTLYHQISRGITKRRAFLSSPYLEHFSNRYQSFHGRVALPSPHKSEPGVGN